MAHERSILDELGEKVLSYLEESDVALSPVSRTEAIDAFGQILRILKHEATRANNAETALKELRRDA